MPGGLPLDHGRPCGIFRALGAISLVASVNGIGAIYMADGARLGNARQAAGARIGPKLALLTFAVLLALDYPRRWLLGTNLTSCF
jgi:hypothetical protein